MRQQAIKEGKEVKLQKAQYEWGKGSVQKEEEKLMEQELKEIALEPFARTADNARLEAMRKEVIRDGDPMAAYFEKKREEEQSKLDEEEEREARERALARGDVAAAAFIKPRKPTYKGPPPRPNRFAIKPGYRWDGIERGNQFELKLLKRGNDRASLKEDEYRWSVSDM
jgi:pre-mRNA-splicing factor CWC26